MSDFGKGFSISSLKYMRVFYVGYPRPFANWSRSA
jgi:hypothetical protein